MISSKFRRPILIGEPALRSLHRRASCATHARFVHKTGTGVLRLPKKFENERSDDRPDSSLSIGNRLESDVSCSAINTTETYIKVNFYI